MKFMNFRNYIMFILPALLIYLLFLPDRSLVACTMASPTGTVFHSRRIGWGWRTSGRLSVIRCC